MHSKVMRTHALDMKRTSTVGWQYFFLFFRGFMGQLDHFSSVSTHSIVFGLSCKRMFADNIKRVSVID